MYGSTRIGDYAFANCRNLKTVDEAGGNFYNRGLAPGTQVGEGVFLNCVSLKGVTISRSTDVDIEVFSGCTAMREVTYYDPENDI